MTDTDELTAYVALPIRSPVDAALSIANLARSHHKHALDEAVTTLQRISRSSSDVETQEQALVCLSRIKVLTGGAP